MKLTIGTRIGGAFALMSLLLIAGGEGDLTVTIPSEGNDEIANVAKGFNLFVARIRSVEEQSSVAEEISRNVVAIRDVAETTGEGAAKMGAASTDLARLAADLKVTAGHFRV